MKKIKRMIAVVLLIAVLVTGGYFVYTAKQTEGADAKRTEILYDC